MEKKIKAIKIIGLIIGVIAAVCALLLVSRKKQKEKQKVQRANLLLFVCEIGSASRGIHPPCNMNIQ